MSLVKKYTEKLKEDKDTKTKRVTGRIAAGIILFGMIIILLAILGSSTMWGRIVDIALMVVFLISLVLSISLERYENKSGFAGALYKASSVITIGVGIFIKLVFPAVLLCVGFMAIVLVPYSVIWMLLRWLASVVMIKDATVLFVSLSLGAIISAYYSKPLFRYLSRLLTANGHRYEKYSQEFVEYVYQPANIQYAIYALYFLYLSIATIFRFQTGGKPMLDESLDLAVLESFLVFIAFSNMRLKRKTASCNSTEIFKILYRMITTRDFQEDSNNEL